MARFGELNVDIAETIRGLKAIQREAKKATQALAELQATQQAYGSGTLTSQDGTIIATVSDVTVTLADVDEVVNKLNWRWTP